MTSRKRIKQRKRLIQEIILGFAVSSLAVIISAIFILGAVIGTF